MSRRILEGVRVLDLTQVVAGPVTTRILADLGADVVKIDRPDSRTREGRPGTAGPEAQNVGKRSIVVDLTSGEGVAIAKRLAKRSDVLVENYRPNSLAALGLGFDDLREENPRLVYATICGFGRNTSSSLRPAYGATAHAEAGWLWVQQQARGGDEPFAPGVTVADILAGMNTAMAILAALFDRVSTGRGQRIDISLTDSQMAMLGEVAGPALNGASESEWRPFRHGLQRAKDGYLAVNLGSARNWPRLARAMGRDGLELPEERAEAERMLAEWIGTRTVAEASAALQAQGAAYGRVQSLHEAVAEPYFDERGLFAEAADAAGRPLRVVNTPLFFSDAVCEATGRSPRAGEHTREVLAQLGYGDAAVADLVASGVAATWLDTDD